MIATNIIYNKIKKGYNNINFGLGDLKKQEIQKYLEKINLLEYVYQMLTKRCNDVFYFFELIIQNYQKNTHNYYYLEDN